MIQSIAPEAAYRLRGDTTSAASTSGTAEATAGGEVCDAVGFVCWGVAGGWVGAEARYVASTSAILRVSTERMNLDRLYGCVQVGRRTKHCLEEAEFMKPVAARAATFTEGPRR